MTDAPTKKETCAKHIEWMELFSICVATELIVGVASANRRDDEPISLERNLWNHN